MIRGTNRKCRDEFREQQRQIEDMKITCQIQLEQQESR